MRSIRHFVTTSPASVTRSATLFFPLFPRSVHTSTEPRVFSQRANGFHFVSGDALPADARTSCGTLSYGTRTSFSRKSDPSAAYSASIFLLEGSRPRTLQVVTSGSPGLGFPSTRKNVTKFGAACDSVCMRTISPAGNCRRKLSRTACSSSAFSARAASGARPATRNASQAQRTMLPPSTSLFIR
jgi:hypothetical protein